MIVNRRLHKNVDEVKLSRSVTVAQYLEWVNEPDPKKEKITDFIKERFHERYILPVAGDDCERCEPNDQKSGFAMMAIACLMIEALESFYQGWPNSDGHKGEDIFNQFFARYQEFAPLQGQGRQFYKHIRCGILHQAETTGGWRIRRNQPIMVDLNNKIIDAATFMKNLKACLDHYCAELVNKKWDDPLWNNFRRKMNSIIKNCS